MPDFDLVPVEGNPFGDQTETGADWAARLKASPGYDPATDSYRIPEGPGAGMPPLAKPPSPAEQIKDITARSQEERSRFPTPPLEEQVKAIGSAVTANPVFSMAERAAGGEPQPPLSDDPAEMDRYQEELKRHYGGNFMDILGIAAPQMAHAEEGAAGIFGGRGAKTADLDKLKAAELMEQQGAQPSSIWRETGWGRGRDGKWRFEIDDSNARWKMDPNKLPKGITMGEAFDHPELYAAYPDMANMGAETLRKNAAVYGQYTPFGFSDPEKLSIRRGLDPMQARSTGLHELMHGVQSREEFGRGASYSADPVSYMPTSGEVEARNVQKRMDFSPDQRVYTPPWLTEDRARGSQIVKNDFGTIIHGAQGVWDTNSANSRAGTYFSADPHALVDAHRATNPRQYLSGRDTVAPDERNAALQKQPIPSVFVKDGQLNFESGADVAQWAKGKDINSTLVKVPSENREALLELLARHGDRHAFNHFVDKISEIPDDQMTPELKAFGKGLLEDFNAANGRRLREMGIGLGIELPKTPEKPEGMVLPPKDSAPQAMSSAPTGTKIGALGSGDDNQGKAPAGWISQRMSSGKKGSEDTLGTPSLVNVDALRKSPEAFQHNAALTEDYPNFVSDKEALGNYPPEMRAEAQIDKVKEQAKANLRFIYENYKQFRERAKLWYDGANKMAVAQAQKYGMQPNQVAGVYAALSPQKDWYQNVSLGDRAMEIYHTKQNEKFSKDMAVKGKELFTPDDPEKPTAADIAQGKMLDAMIKNKPTLGSLKTPEEKAMWIRIFDETNNPRDYHVLSPEGEKMDYALRKDGQRRAAAWGSLKEIGKAVSAMESGGDVNTLSKLMGQRHKVRNFFNNILHPNADMGDVTIDTHAVAAALMRPLSQSDAEVLHNFMTSPQTGKKPSGWQAAKGSATTGVNGTYAIYADAYRELAQELGIKPRELQSITWEGIRGLFPQESKRAGKALGQVVDQIWKDPNLTIAQKQEKIRAQAGGFRPPTWFKPGK